MINTGDKVKLNAEVTATGTGTFTISIEDFFLDGAWWKLVPTKELEISTDDYTTDLTEKELEYIKLKAGQDIASLSVKPEELEIATSISKKLSGETTD